MILKQKEYLAQKILLINKKRAQKKLPHKEIANTFENYIYYLLKEELQKNSSTENKKIANTLALEMIFRGFYSLQKYGACNDQQVQVIWQKLQQKKIFLSQENQFSFHLALKKAFNQNIPFSVVTAWLNILAWTFLQNHLSHHEQKLVFRIEKPFIMILTINPNESLNLLLDYLKKNLFLPKCFKEIYTTFLAQEKNLKSNSLEPYIDQLDINFRNLFELIDKFLNHSEPFCKQLGIHLYLSMPTLRVQEIDLHKFFYHLPHLLQSLNPLLKSQLINRLLLTFSPLASSPYLQILDQIKKELELEKNFSKFDWINLFIKAKNKKLIFIAYFFWQQLFKIVSLQEYELSLELALTITPFSVKHALQICTLIHQSNYFNLDKELICYQNIIKLIELHSISPFLFSHLLEWTTLILEKSNLLNKEQTLNFTKDFNIFIQKIYKNRDLHKRGDIFLYEGTVKGFITSALWHERLKGVSEKAQLCIVCGSINWQSKPIFFKNFYQLNNKRLKF